MTALLTHKIWSYYQLLKKYFIKLLINTSSSSNFKLRRFAIDSNDGKGFSDNSVL